MTMSELITVFFISCLGSGIATSYINNKFAISRKATKLKHKICNSEISMILSVSYESNYPFEKIKDYVKNEFREKCGQLKVYLDNERQLDFEVVNGGFHVIIEYNTYTELSIRTSKIVRHMNTIVKTVEYILDVSNKIKKEIKKKDDTIKLEEKDFSIYLYLPYKQIFTNFYTPKKIII